MEKKKNTGTTSNIKGKRFQLELNFWCFAFTELRNMKSFNTDEGVTIKR